MADRRTMLQLLGATGLTAGLAGCSGGSDGDGSNAGPSDGSGGGSDGGGSTGADPTPTGTPQAEATEGLIYDTFEDGSTKYDLEWDLTAHDRSASVSVVDREAPDGGSQAMRLKDARDGGSGPQRGLYAELEKGAGFAPGPWTVSGQFYLESYPDPDGKNPTKTHISVSELDFIPGGIDEGDEMDTIHLVHETASFGKEEAVSAPRMEEGSWYEYEIRHDGAGTYTATRYDLDDDGNRADSHEISITTEAPLESANIEFYAEGGQGARKEGENPIVVDHSSVRWESDA